MNKLQSRRRRAIIPAVCILLAVFGMSACGSHPPSHQSEQNQQEEKHTTQNAQKTYSQNTQRTKIHVATDGSDHSGSGTPDAPYATVSATAKANPGTLIIVHGGMYGPIELGPECSGSEEIQMSPDHWEENMKIEISQEEPQVYAPQDHPWIEMPDDSVDEIIRYSLDEIRVG